MVPQSWIAKSPFKSQKDLKTALQDYKKGKSIGFSRVASLKSMGLIPRSNGKFEVGPKYKS